MEHMRPAVQDFWKACEKIHIIILARREALSPEERQFIEMTCTDLLAKLHEIESGTSTDA
jgi:hypothetical protein